ncbi:hypothetical protein EUGRSUZ_B01984 [Eucalyptus grandis]|uniref:Uncharacterized protein n=2 Tax=Eucalyptus grandis TaxID=71139 RepID=A0ACC3LS71_EUCGR|nr:hypothetical protein EUGRSUZ_B01984 [Eucalyptus grandis]
MSNVPDRPSPQSPAQRMTLTSLRGRHRRGEPITVITAYDYPSTVHLDMAGVDVCLVGDSAAMVVHGHDTTLPISLDEMLVHCRAAVDTAVRVLKEGGMDAIKLEGGSPSRITAAKAIVEAGIAVMGHVGLTLRQLVFLVDSGLRGRISLVPSRVLFRCFGKCVPAPVAAAATSALKIPTIGIGAGPFCSGQVLVYHDLLGMLQHLIMPRSVSFIITTSSPFSASFDFTQVKEPQLSQVSPKFCKQYAQVGDVINKALLEYKEEVTSGSFPGPAHSPYAISPADVNGFLKELQNLGLEKAASAASVIVEKSHKSKSSDGENTTK